MKKRTRALLPLLLVICLLLSACSAGNTYSLGSIPDYSRNPYVAVNDNHPYFSDTDLKKTSFESYSELDSLGRCGTAYACVSTDTMPTEDRGSIGQIKPSGWHTVKYDCVDG
jgi:DNA-entry nuclease